MDETQHTPVPEALISERTLEHIRNLRLIDDLFMRLCFAHDKTCAQLVLRVVLNRPDLVLVSVETQHTVQGLPGRRSRLLRNWPGWCAVSNRRLKEC